MTTSAYKPSPTRWRMTSVLAVLAWLSMIGMPVIMPAQAGTMASMDAHATAVSHNSGKLGHAGSMAGCCHGDAGQNVDSHGCHCTATCSVALVLPATHLIADLWPTLPRWHMIDMSVMPQTPIPPYRPPRI
ncbi:MAG: hypothetical protein WCD66_12725 [Rhodanobacteraceae bacterium]